MAPAAETPSERAQELVERVVEALGLEASVEVREDAETLTAEVHGDSDDLGLLIGRHGQTIDALQHLAYRTAFRGDGDRKRLVVDAAGYRERREATLRHDGDRAADDAVRLGRPVELDPMNAVERRVVHEHLRERGDVETHSEGDEPARRLVVSPLEP
ncbi:MAG: spoIIIJ-associated protein [Solirubrobacteraceae bacterium]|jgi:spoIIIJ-associated protein|nr:spoIIIJ-associated protein [Solirubrobacteraceae bacterium]